jgi:hypothetical protein
MTRAHNIRTVLAFFITPIYPANGQSARALFGLSGPSPETALRASYEH